MNKEVIYQEQLSSLLSDVLQIKEAISSGILEARINEKKYQDQSLQIVSCLNEVMELAHEKFKSFSDALDYLAEGDSSHELTETMQGDYFVLQHSFNKLRTNLTTYEQIVAQQKWVHDSVSYFVERLMSFEEKTADLLETALAMIMSDTVALKGRIYLYHAESQSLILMAKNAYPDADSVPSLIKLGEDDLIGQVAESRQSLFVHHAEESLQIKSQPLDSYISPFLFKDKLVGVVELVFNRVLNKVQLHYIDHIFGAMASYISLNAELERVKNINEQQQNNLIHQSRYAVMGEMIAMISHQWRQPLSLSMLNIDIIATKINLMTMSDDDRTFLLGRLSLLSNMVTEKSNLINDFTDFFKPSRDKEIFSIALCVRSALAIFDSHFSSHNIQVIDDIDSDFTLFGIERELRQVIINIVKNAIDQLVSAEVKPAYIHICVSQQTDFVTIEIRDNGGGIPSELLPSIFDAYSSTKSLNGTGLGLYMVKMIIVNHFQGEVQASNSEIGAVFRIKIPMLS